MAAIGGFAVRRLLADSGLPSIWWTRGNLMLPRAREGIMARPQAARKVRRIYQFIELHQNQYAVKTMCRLLNITRSGYYAWLKEPVSNRAQEDARLLRLIRASFVASHGIYGAPRVFLDLREAGETCSKHGVARLMRINGIRAAYGDGARRHSATKPSALIPNSLQRNFTVSKPNAA